MFWLKTFNHHKLNDWGFWNLLYGLKDKDFVYLVVRVLRYLLLDTELLEFKDIIMAGIYLWLE